MLSHKLAFLLLLENNLFHKEIVVLVLAFEFDFQLIIELDQSLVFLIGFLSNISHQFKFFNKALLVIITILLILLPLIIFLLQLLLKFT